MKGGAGLMEEIRLRHLRPARAASIVATVLLIVAGCTEERQPTPEPEIAGARVVINGELTAGLPVRYERFNLPRLNELEERERLDIVVDGANGEFEKFLRLKDWVAAQWPHSTPDPYPPWDAMTILDWIREGRTGGFCGQYAQVLLQSLAALGWTARYVEIGSTENPYAHFVVEAWSNQFDKWILLDADFNLHFEREGVPLSALEIHDALIQDRLADVVAVLGDVRIGHDDPAIWPLHTAELYYYLRVHLKADHIWAPHEPPFDRYNDMMEWLDDDTVPWETSEVASPVQKVALTNLGTNDRTAFMGKLNQVEVTVESVEEKEVRLSFEHNAIGFGHYQIRTIDLSQGIGDWQYHDTDFYYWAPAGWGSVLEVRTLNSEGRPGPTSVVQVDMTCTDLLPGFSACN